MVVIRLLVGTRAVYGAVVVCCRVSAVARGVSSSGVVDRRRRVSAGSRVVIRRRRVLIVARGVVDRGVVAVGCVIDASTAGIV